MAFGKVTESRDNAPIKRFVGFGSVSIKGVNPTKEELEKFYGRPIESEPEYTGTSEVNGKQVPFVRLSFLAEVDSEKYKDADGLPVNCKTQITFFLRKEGRTSNSGKFQVIDKYGRTQWVTPDEFANKAIPLSKAGNPLGIDKNYRRAYSGEEDLIKFIKCYLGITNVEKWANGQVVGLIDNPEDAECALEHIEDYFKGNIQELKDAIGLAPNNKIKVLFGVRTADNGSQYQSVYTRDFLFNGATNYNRVIKSVTDAKTAGALATTEFDFGELHEYVVNSTDFTAKEDNDTFDMPFAESSDDSAPW